MDRPFTPLEFDEAASPAEPVVGRRDFMAALAAGHAAFAPGAQGGARDTGAQTGLLASAAPSPKALYQAELFPIRNIRLLEGPFGRQQEMNRRYLLKLDPDRLLSWFRREAGLPPKAPPYRGWESEPPYLPGHILGFYMSGAGMMYEATGDPGLRARLDYIVDQLNEVQNAHGSGYLLPVAGGKKLFVEIAKGNFRITNAEPNYGYQINDVFEPTYTWNKLTLGLSEIYRATGNERAKHVLVRTADWFGGDVLDRLTDEQVQMLLFCEHGSIHESMLEVYLLTGNERYLNWARRLCFERMLVPLAENRGQFLDGYHANCSIPIYTGFERVFDYTGETRLHAAAANFADEVIRHRSWVIGGNSAREHFFPANESEKALHEPAGPESCNSVNMLRLIEALYRTRPTPEMMDHYERILWNHLLAAHEPERGMICYYTPMQPGTYRVYSDEFDSMWCCVGTGLECPGKYGQMIYTHAPDNSSLDVNLFIASELVWKEGGMALRQETRFPEEPATTLVVTAHPPKPLAIRIRHPAWIPSGEMKVTVNNRPVDSSSAPGDFVSVNRRWRDGDTMRVALPMHLTLERLPNSSNYAALLYGPIVLSGALGTEGLTKFDFWQIETTVPKMLIEENRFPAIVASSADKLLQHIQPVPERPLTFRTVGGLMQPEEVQLIPFYRNHYQRYAVYWRTVKPEDGH